MEKEDNPLEKLEIRYTELSDTPHVRDWLMDPTVATWFPMADAIEIDDAANRWVSFARYRCSLTAVMDGVPCGIATLYLQPYKKLAHQCEFGIIVAPGFRNKGIGSDLLKNLIHLAKEYFKSIRQKPSYALVSTIWLSRVWMPDTLD
jgi:RimJ/RimL family protein N-acetyltransferase